MSKLIEQRFGDGPGWQMGFFDGELQMAGGLTTTRGAWLLCVLGMVLLAGCGRQSTVAFGNDTMPLAKNLHDAIARKDTKALDRAIQAVEKRADGKISSEERAALVWCADQAKAGKWDEAYSYLQKCFDSAK